MDVWQLELEDCSRDVVRVKPLHNHDDRGFRHIVETIGDGLAERLNGARALDVGFAAVDVVRVVDDDAVATAAGHLLERAASPDAGGAILEPLFAPLVAARDLVAKEELIFFRLDELPHFQIVAEDVVEREGRGQKPEGRRLGRPFPRGPENGDEEGFHHPRRDVD